MDTTNVNWVVLAVILIAVLAAVAAWIYSQRRKQSERLKQRFGPEYQNTVERLGSQTRAEAELAAREKASGGAEHRAADARGCGTVHSGVEHVARPLRR